MNHQYSIQWNRGDLCHLRDANFDLGAARTDEAHRLYRVSITFGKSDNNDGANSNGEDDEDDAGEGPSATKTTPKPTRKTHRTSKPTQKKGPPNTSTDLTVHKHRHDSKIWTRDATPVADANVPKSGPGKTVPQGRTMDGICTRITLT